MKNIKIFVIFHKDIKLEYYKEEILPHIVFVNVNQNNNYLENINDLKLSIINLHDFSNYVSLGRQYAESEVIYNLFRNKKYIKKLDYIGFLHHDMDVSMVSLNQILSLCDKYDVISFDSHIIKDDYNNMFLMDRRKPNVWQGLGKNCYEQILEDINNHQKKEVKIEEIKNKHITLCCAFLLKSSKFEILMGFISKIIESKKLEIFDSDRRYRMQGGLLERYVGIWLTINIPEYYYLKVDHHFHETNLVNSKNNYILTLLKKSQLKLIKILKRI